MIIPANIMSPEFRVVYQHGTGRPVPSPDAPLDAGQKARLCILAREAFEHIHNRPPSSQSELDSWRRAEQKRACGVASLCVATQREYKLIEGRLLELKGRAKAAVRALERAATEPRRLAYRKLEIACVARCHVVRGEQQRVPVCERCGVENPFPRFNQDTRRACQNCGHDPIVYAAAICRTQFKRGLAEASDRQLWNLVYTARNRKKRITWMELERLRSLAPAKPQPVAAGEGQNHGGQNHGEKKQPVPDDFAPHDFANPEPDWSEMQPAHDAAGNEPF